MNIKRGSISKITPMNMKNRRENARKEAIQNYSIKDKVKKIESIYKEAVR